MRNCGVTQNVVYRCTVVAGTRFITPKTATTLTKTLAQSGTNVAW